MTKEDPYITWGELKELVEKNAMGVNVDHFHVKMSECLDGTAPTGVIVSSANRFGGGPTIWLGT